MAGLSHVRWERLFFETSSSDGRGNGQELTLTGNLLVISFFYLRQTRMEFTKTSRSPRIKRYWGVWNQHYLKQNTNKHSSLVNGFAQGLIYLYQMTFSFWLGGHCRFSPSCSEYALQAFQQKSFFTAMGLILKRMIRCHPWGSFGYDPVPMEKAQ